MATSDPPDDEPEPMGDPGVVGDRDDDGDPLAELPPSTPEPGPAPNPNPNPNPDPFPNPSPSPDPFPNPSPSPDPFPNPNPSPSPSPDPKPAPKPDPKPAARSKPVAKRADTADDDAPKGPRKKWPLYLAGLATVGAAIAVLIVLGRVHASQYALRCHPKDIRAERGRSFPPWGYERLDGAAWKPIAVPPDVECTERWTDDVVQLEGWYLEALVEQATRKLAGTAPGDLDQAEAELEQALLLSRSPERRDQRKELERLRGDVTYWRAVARVKLAVSTLEDAAARFDEASAQRPRHAADPSRWADFARATAQALGAGPDGAGVPSLPSAAATPIAPPRPLAPPGVALPVDPTPTVPDAGVPTEDAPRRDLPTGGVLM